MIRLIYFTLLSALLFSALLLSCGKSNKSMAPPDIPPDPPGNGTAPDKYLVLAEQSQPAIMIVDATTAATATPVTAATVWEWQASTTNNIRLQDMSWFTHPTEAKPVYNNNYILGCFDSAVVLLRIRDKKAVFYAKCDGAPHSAALLPDGNIVVATIGAGDGADKGDFLITFKVDTLHFPDNVYRHPLSLPGVHNAVWDRTRQVLWAAGTSDLESFTYNNDCAAPALSMKSSIQLPVQPGNAHDLFPVYGKDSLFLATGGKLWYFNPRLSGASAFSFIKDATGVKSISSGPDGYPICILQAISDASYWDDKLTDLNSGSNVIYYQAGAEIYKGRWLLPDTFGYEPADSIITICH